MYIDIYTLPHRQGMCCERCGTYIETVAEIHFNDGFVLRCGLDCLNKHVLKETNLTEYGIKTLKKFMKSLKEYDKSRRLWKSCNSLDDLKAAHEQQPKTYIFVMWPSYGWKTDHFEEITQAEFEKEKQWILSDLIPTRINGVKQDMEKTFKRTIYKRQVEKIIDSAN